MISVGDHLDWPYEVISPAILISNANLHINSSIPDAHLGAHYLGIDISNFYFSIDMPYHQYMWVHPFKITKEIWDKYNINIAPVCFVYLDIRKGMYGFKEASVLVFNKLVRDLFLHVYKPMPNTIGLWIHKTRKTTFVLYVDNFGVWYFSKDDAHHLIDALQEKYKITLNWEGSLYCGMDLKWNYSKVWVNIHMPGYVIWSLTKSNHPDPEKPEHASHPWITPVYSSRQQ